MYILEEEALSVQPQSWTSNKHTMCGLLGNVDIARRHVEDSVDSTGLVALERIILPVDQVPPKTAGRVGRLEHLEL
jgi:hypothetical protein